MPEDPADLTVLWEWLERQHTVAVDTETTGLDIYSDRHQLRLIALATPKEAWVFPFETFGRRVEIEEALVRKRTIMHNASYDLQVFGKHLCLPRDSMWKRVRDTKIIAHQIDPRGRDEGGIGQSLDELVKNYMPEYSKLGSDLKDEFIRLKAGGEIPKGTSLTDMWSTLPIGNEMYLTYAGTDAILTARLFKLFTSLVDVNSKLTQDDHTVAMIASLMDARGFLLDTGYTLDLRDRLLSREAWMKEIASDLGLENINSPDQVAAAMQARGLEIEGKTPTGKPKVDKVFFAANMDDELVKAVVEGKKAGKWRTTWVEKFLAAADSTGRVHPSTNTLRARTARFSITGIPAQTLPSSDSLVRSCFVADTGEVVVGIDYAQQELRFAAAHAKDARMIRAFREGEDLHYITAEAAWPGRGKEMRKHGKTGNFGSVYGVGPRGLMDQTGLTWDQARNLIESIKRAYPGLRKLGERLGEEARDNGYITTWTGRRLPVDVNRLYSALNYFVQSGCRDITAQAMIRLYEAGYVEYMRLAIHDELLFSMPNDPEMIRDVERLMSTRVGKVELPAEAKIGSRSWGSLYEDK